MEALQIEHWLGHSAVTGLLHPQYAVHAFYRAAGSDRVLEDGRDLVISRLLGILQW
jgi:hypothetical protein